MSTHYAFKERIANDELITPHADPMEYEFAIDFIWPSQAKAMDWLQNDADDWGVETEESSGWVLVKVTEEVVYSP